MWIQNIMELRFEAKYSRKILRGIPIENNLKLAFVFPLQGLVLTSWIGELKTLVFNHIINLK